MGLNKSYRGLSSEIFKFDKEASQKISNYNSVSICENAEKINWVVDRNDRKTFIKTPYNFRIELQVNLDVIDSLNNEIKIEKMKLVNGESSLVHLQSLLNWRKRQSAVRLFLKGNCLCWVIIEVEARTAAI
jgi:hypothetical protein